jgi:two-component system NtrC family sensor kinase
MPSLTDRLALSVRAKLILLVLAPLLLGLPILVALVIYWADTSYDRLLIIKINGDLVAAQKYFERVVESVGSDLQGLARSTRLERALMVKDRASMQEKDRSALQALLDRERETARLDFLHYLDRDGRLVVPQSADDATAWWVIKEAKSGFAKTRVDIFSGAQLAAIDPALRDRANLPLIETQNAAPTDKQAETRGMVIHTAAPVTNDKGEIVGILRGGMMLNRNLEFVDRINEIVYREGSLPQGSHGTATLFLDDVRISTNVRLFQGERALGTRVSKSVRDRVLGEGKTWLDRAFVVKDWYVSGYEPIVDSNNDRVGMLYVGYLEEPFRRAKINGLAAIIALFVVISIVGSVLSLAFARRIFQPLERMDATMKAAEAGDVAARVGPVASRDEIGAIASELDALLDTLARRNAELKDYADGLDRKVAERTAELEQANQSLRDAQRQLVMSEKLAAIGQLTAGVAHEINNPIAVIQGNLDMLKSALGQNAQPVQEEIRLIHEQVNRVRVIVTKLLQFARPEEFAGYVEAVDVNAAIADMLVLVRHQVKSGDVRVVEQLHATRQIGINRNELLQVLINLTVNAIQAMPKGGTLTLTTRDWESEDGTPGVEIEVSDTGAGIAAENLPRIFDPFFTTKKQQGTGLGLSISYALLERYGATIAAQSTVGEGTNFTLQLFCEPRYQAGPATPLPKR